MRIRSMATAGACAALVMVGFTGVASAAPTGGANGDGPFTAVVDPYAPSGNGQGAAPHLAGSKGKADDKNPPGQFKKFNDDPDYGYECDGNSGVARGNPAHSGCSIG